MKLSTESNTRKIATMPLDEFMRLLKLPNRPVTIFVSWDGSDDAVRIYMEATS